MVVKKPFYLAAVFRARRAVPNLAVCTEHPMVQRYQPLLHVRSRTTFLGTSEHHTDFSIVDFIK